MTLTKLIAALEAADGPSRDLDACILAVRRADGDMASLDFPLYTSSLDAAVTLVPEGCSYTIYVNGDGHPARRHPALALCIVALKAREAME